MAARRSIPVTIQGREYKVRAERDPAAVREAATLLDETMTRVRGRSGTVDSVDVAVLAALNIADSLVASRDASAATAAFDLRCEELASAIEAALRD